MVLEKLDIDMQNNEHWLECHILCKDKLKMGHKSKYEM